MSEFIVTIIGRVTNDPELRKTQSGMSVSSFNVATSEYRGKAKCPECPDGWKESYNSKGWELTTFVKVTAWRYDADRVAGNLHKGDSVYVRGKLKGTVVDGKMNPRIWTGNDGVPQASWEVEIHAYGGKLEIFPKGARSSTPAAAPAPTFVKEDEIPF